MTPIVFDTFDFVAMAAIFALCRCLIAQEPEGFFGRVALSFTIAMTVFTGTVAGKLAVAYLENTLCQ